MRMLEKDVAKDQIICETLRYSTNGGQWWEEVG